MPLNRVAFLHDLFIPSELPAHAGSVVFLGKRVVPKQRRPEALKDAEELSVARRTGNAGTAYDATQHNAQQPLTKRNASHVRCLREMVKQASTLATPILSPVSNASSSENVAAMPNHQDRIVYVRRRVQPPSTQMQSAASATNIMSQRQRAIRIGSTMASIAPLTQHGYGPGRAGVMPPMRSGSHVSSAVSRPSRIPGPYHLRRAALTPVHAPTDTLHSRLVQPRTMLGPYNLRSSGAAPMVCMAAA